MYTRFPFGPGVMQGIGSIVYKKSKNVRCEYYRWVVETHNFASCYKKNKNVSYKYGVRLKERWIAIVDGVACTWYVQVDIIRFSR